MKLFSFSKKTESVPGGIKSLAERAEPSRSDSDAIRELLQIMPGQRDIQWMRSFYDYVKTAAFTPGKPQVIKDTEGFPYFVLRAPDPGSLSNLSCIANLKSDILLENGFGVTIIQESSSAQWRFSYGEILNLHLNNEFISKEPASGIQHIEMTKKVQVLKKGDEVMLAQPSESYLPAQTRSVLRKYLQDAGVQKPKIMLICRKFNGEFVQQLAFNIHSEKMNPADHDLLMQKITWFLPKHYLVISFHDGCDMMKYFEAL